MTNSIPDISVQTQKWLPDGWKDSDPYVLIDCDDPFYSVRLETADAVNEAIRRLEAARDTAWPNHSFSASPPAASTTTE